MPNERARTGMLLAGGVIVAGAVGVALVEWLRFPKGTIWLVVGATVVTVAIIRRLTAGRR
jgi:hypothetical protein